MKLICFFLIMIIYTTGHNCFNSLNKKTEKNKESEMNILQNKVMSRVTALAEDESSLEAKTFSYYSKMYFRKLFSFNSPLNKCQEENCKFCCLSLNYCGTQQQCENSNFTMNIFKFLFLSVVIILVTFLIYKIYITDAEPEHTDEDKIDDNMLSLLIGLFIQNRENRRKFKP